MKLIFVSIIVLTISIPHSHAQEFHNNAEINHDVTCLVQDLENHIWIGTWGSGLYCFSFSGSSIDSVCSFRNDQSPAGCWRENKEDWLAAWRYYFKETPLGKADIFILRPRNQVWDWEYKSLCGEDKTEVFNEVYAELGELIDSYNTRAKKVGGLVRSGKTSP